VSIRKSAETTPPESRTVSKSLSPFQYRHTNSIKTPADTHGPHTPHPRFPRKNTTPRGKSRGSGLIFPLAGEFATWHVPGKKAGWRLSAFAVDRRAFRRPDFSAARTSFFPGTRHTMAAAGKLKPDPRLFPRGPSSFFAVNGLLHQCLNAGEGSGSASEITRFCHCIRPFLTP